LAFAPGNKQIAHRRIDQWTKYDAVVRQIAQRFRHQGDSATRSNQTKDRVSALDHLQRARPKASQITSFEHVPPCAWVTLVGDPQEKIFGETREGDPRFARCPMIFRQRGDKRTRPYLPFVQARAVRLVSKPNKAGIQFAIHESPSLLQSSEIEQMDGDSWRTLPEPMQHCRREGVEQTPHVANVQRSFAGPGGTARSLDSLLALAKQRPRLGLKSAAGLGEPHAAFIPFQELDAHLFFELANLAAQRGLRHAQLLRCPREIQFSGDGDKIAQVPQFHAAPIMPKQHESANKEVLAGLRPDCFSSAMSRLLAGTSSQTKACTGPFQDENQGRAQADNPGIGFWNENVFAKRTRLMRRSAIRESLKLASQPEVISFAGGLPAAELFPMHRFKSAMERTLETIGPASLQYSETEGIGALRDWIAQRFSRNGAKVTRENVLITTGAQQALHLLGLVCLEAGDHAIVENPTYLALLSCWRPLGPKLLPVRSDAKGIDFEALETSRSQTPKLMYVCPNFQNPQGTTMPLEVRERLVEWCAKSKVVLIEDDAYGMLRYNGEPLPWLWTMDASQSRGRTNSVIHVGSFSKVLMPGLRLGWVIGPEAVIERLVLAKQAADLQTSTFNQYLALELLNANYLEEVVPDLIREYRLRRDTMLAALERSLSGAAKWTRPDGGMFLFLTLPEGVDATKLLPRALKRKVAFVPGEEFHADGSGKNTLRLNFSNANHARIEEGIRRLAAVIGEPATA